ncbi:MAG: hypothetical protein ACI8PD_001683, partial [Nitrospinales bacterium]
MEPIGVDTRKENVDFNALYYRGIASHVIGDNSLLFLGDQIPLRFWIYFVKRVFPPCIPYARKH